MVPGRGIGERPAARRPREQKNSEKTGSEKAARRKGGRKGEISVAQSIAPRMGAIGHRMDSVNLEDLIMFHRTALTSSSDSESRDVSLVRKRTPNPMPLEENS
jgi:hypothetical protein